MFKISVKKVNNNCTLCPRSAPVPRVGRGSVRSPSSPGRTVSTADTRPLHQGEEKHPVTMWGTDTGNISDEKSNEDFYLVYGVAFIFYQKLGGGCFVNQSMKYY